jgi:predicted TIM-barrel fold metal-dependent hydrolase
VMIIDCHTHVLSPRIKNKRSQYVGRDAAFDQIYSGDKVKIATAEDLIDSMDRDGVDISVIVNYGWSTHELCVETNDYILESVARYPSRLCGFCAVSSYVDDASLAEIERCAGGGIRGIGELRPDMQSLDYSRKEVLKPFSLLLRKHKLIVLTHASEPVGHIYPGKGAATPGLLYSFIASLPDLPVVCAHWGGGLPFYALMPEVRAVLENVYFDTAASPFLYRPEIYLQVSQLIGADRILFGSDFPVMPQRRLINEINNTGLPEENRDEILAGNARRLLGI